MRQIVRKQSPLTRLTHIGIETDKQGVKNEIVSKC